MLCILKHEKYFCFCFKRTAATGACFFLLAAVSYQAFVSVQEDLEEEEYPEGFKLAGSVPQAAQEPDQNQDKAAAGMLRNSTFALTKCSISTVSNLPSLLVCCIVAEAVLPIAHPCLRGHGIF